MRGLYGKVLPEVICTDRGTKEQGQCGIPKAKLFRRDRVNDVNKGFVTSQFVLTSEKVQETISLPKTFIRIYWWFWQCACLLITLTKQRKYSNDKLDLIVKHMNNLFRLKQQTFYEK